MLEEMTWGQFMGWVTYSEVEPFGEERADLRAGIIASIIANVNRDPKKGKAYQPTDFMPKFGKVGKAGKPLTSVDEWKKFRNQMKAGMVVVGAS